jgi:hypothetical protein
MNRRSFIGTLAGFGVLSAGYAATGVLSGGQPEPEAVRLFSPKPRWVSDDHEDHGTYEEFTATIQNTGEEGVIIADLYLSNRRVEDVNRLSEDTLQNDDEFVKIATQDGYFDADERRDLLFRERIPEENDMEHVYYWTKPATLGALIKNNGASGNIRVMLLEGEEGDKVQIDEQTVRVESDETERVTFESDSFSSEKWWNVEVEPAD